MREQRPVLVIEDDADACDLLCEAFTGEGFAVLAAANGRDALDLLLMDGQPEPFLIILDLDMPTMSGWEFLDIVGR